VSLRLPNPRRGLKGHNSWQPELHGGGKKRRGQEKNEQAKPEEEREKRGPDQWRDF